MPRWASAAKTPLREVRAALNDLKRASEASGDAPRAKALDVASAEITSALADLSIAESSLVGMRVGIYVRFLLVFFQVGVEGLRWFALSDAAEAASDLVKASCDGLIDSVTKARNHLSDTAPGLSPKLDLILESVGETTQNGPSPQPTGSRTALPWDATGFFAVFAILHDPIRRVLSDAWGGLRRATIIGWLFFFVTFVVSILGLGRVVLFAGFLIVEGLTFDLIGLIRDAVSCLRALFADSPHPMDPIGHIELVLGILLKHGIQHRLLATYFGLGLETRGHPWTVIIGFASTACTSFLKFLVLYLAVYAICALVYVVSFAAWKLSQPPADSDSLFVNTARGGIQLVKVIRGALSWCNQSLCGWCWWPSAEPESPFFRYGPLDPTRREIRLLKIKKAGPFMTPAFELVTFPLASAPMYDAMSYRWEAYCPIPCKECYISVRSIRLVGRLVVGHKVRRFVHARAPPWGVRWLWIDAVCINQENDVEKISQIRMMGDIYRSARRTVVWLDAEPSTSLLDLTLMHLLTRYLQPNETLILQMSSPEAFLPGFSGAILRRMWRARTKLLHQSYWSRGWIVQEVVLAKSTVVVYGSQLLDWFGLLSSVATGHSDNQIHQMEWRTDQIFISELEAQGENGPARNGVQGRENRRQILLLGMMTMTPCLQPLSQTDMAALLSMSMDRECSVAEDKVLCLLGMVTNQDAFVGDTVQGTFQNTAQTLLPTHPDFILQCGGIGYRKKVTGLPTWVPDWSAVSVHEHNPVQVVTESLEANQEVPRSIAESGGVAYRAGMLAPAESDLRIEPMVALLPGACLRIHGLGLSRISDLSVPCLRRFRGMVLKPQDLSAIVEFQGKIVDPYPHTGGTAEDAFARTLIGDSWPILTSGQTMPTRSIPAPPSILENYRHFQVKVAEEGASLARLPGSEHWDPDFDYSHLLEPAESAMDPDDYDMGAKYLGNLVVRGKRVCLTADGHVGLVPHLTQIGDEIVVVPGLQRPILIRPSAGLGQYDLVGSCYIHGIMAGEIWEQRENEVLGVYDIR